MIFNSVYCFLCFILHIKIVLSLSLAKESKVENKENSNYTLQESNLSLMMDGTNSEEANNNTKIRAKRQSGGGASKFTDAAKMPQVKMMRLFTQLFKNFWDAAYIGGTHPFHPEIPKVIVALYKQRIVEFFVPDVGEDPEKEKQ